jgi:DNA-binding MarR family transcriptional regulator
MTGGWGRRRRADPFASFLDPGAYELETSYDAATETADRVMTVLAEVPRPMPMERLAEVLGLSQLDVADVVRTLQGRGQVSMTRSPDDGGLVVGLAPPRRGG